VADGLLEHAETVPRVTPPCSSESTWTHGHVSTPRDVVRPTRVRSATGGASLFVNSLSRGFRAPSTGGSPTSVRKRGSPARIGILPDPSRASYPRPAPTCCSAPERSSQWNCRSVSILHQIRGRRGVLAAGRGEGERAPSFAPAPRMNCVRSAGYLPSKRLHSEALFRLFGNLVGIFAVSRSRSERLADGLVGHVQGPCDGAR